MRREVQRLFFALWPQAGLRRRIVAATTRLEADHRTGGRRLRPEHFHLTLRFLASFAPVPESLVDAAIAAAGDVRVPAFELSLDRAGTFGGKRVRWLGPSCAPPGLGALWQALGLALDGRNVPCETGPESAWTPHVTILRGLRRALPASAIPPLSWTADGFVLIRSQSSDPGYEVLQHWWLDD